MTTSDPFSAPPRALLDRQRECALLDELLEAARAGRGGIMVIRGEAGIGKTALLDYAARAAADLRLVRVAGVESEMELAFAVLHQLCTPMLDCLPLLPEPQRDALAIALGLRSGPAPDRFLVGLGLLSLLSEAAEDRPLVCLIDDGHWLDRASERALAFAARRLLAEPVLLVIAGREPGADLSGLPDFTVEGLPDPQARELLASVVRWPMDERVRERVLGEARGNPLALRELPRDGALMELTGGFGLPGTPLADRIEERLRAAGGTQDRQHVPVHRARAGPRRPPVGCLGHGGGTERYGAGGVLARELSRRSMPCEAGRVLRLGLTP